MKLSRPVLVTCLLLGVSVLRSIAGEKPWAPLEFGTAPWPAHPTLLFARYHGSFAPVVAADKDAPVIQVDGQRKSLSSSTELVLRLGSEYAPGKMSFSGGLSSEEKHQTIQGTPSADPLDSVSAQGVLTLKPDRDLPDCYLLLVTFDAVSLQYPDADDHLRTTLQEIGTLRAGESRTVPFGVRRVFNDPLYDGNRTSDIYVKPMTAAFWQLFSHGQEVKMHDMANVKIANQVTAMSAGVARLPQSTHGLGLFFYQHERAGHPEAVEVWTRANRRGNHGAEPYAQTPLATGTAEGLPRSASAILSIGADGKVKDVVLEGAFPAEAAHSLGNSLRLWLFLPAIKHGEPAPTRVRIPLEF